MDTFKGLGLSEVMLKTIAGKGFGEPTAIQQAIIPFLMDSRRDVVAQAETGTGKTAAFAIPLLERLGEPDGRVKALVLVPTRELAIQVAGEIRSLCPGRRIQVVSVYGGQPFAPQRSALKHGADIVVGTTGRILDHLEKRTLCLKDLTDLVLDEADEMLDMGFVDDIAAIMAHTPGGRRTLLFSATMPKEVLAIARRHMGAYETIATGPKNHARQLIDQVYVEVREQDRFEALCRIIDREPGFYGLVFCRTRSETASVADMLIERGYAAECIHGEIEQAERERIMKRLRSRQTTVMVATDVAARGIDVRDLTHVINYDPPQDPDSYVHRIGRTGRAGRTGMAVTLVIPRERRALDLIRRTTGKAMRRGGVPAVTDIVAAKRARIEEEIRQVMHAEDAGPYALLAASLLEGAEPAAVLASCLRHAYGDELDPKTYREIRALAPQSRSEAHTRLFVARGRRHGMTHRNLLRFIREHTGVKERLVKDIEIKDDFAFLTVPPAEAALIQKRFGRSKGRPLVGIARPGQGRKMAG